MKLDTLTVRTIVILIIGALLIEMDIVLVTAFIENAEQSPFGLLAIVVVVLAGLIFIGYIISRQLIKPLRQFSATATRFSTDMHTDPLPIKGPYEVRETAKSFNLMQERVQRFVEERMQLIGAISHDLRTPLTRLRLRVEELTDEEQRQKALDDIEDMKVMIQSTLSFIRDDAAKEMTSKVDIASMLRTICDDTSDTFGPVAYTGPDKCTCVCRSNALKRALNNLIENAVKYGKNAQVRLKCDWDYITIDIEDQGSGIDPDELEKVFMPFYRVEKSRNRETGGVGLGLSVARTIIQAHGGDITLANASPSGLLASVSLPSHR